MAEHDEEWGPWVEHDGKGCPCVGKYVRVAFRNGEKAEFVAAVQSIKSGYNPHGPGSAWFWHDPQAKYSCHGAVDLFVDVDWEVVAFRIRKPRALRDLIKLAETVPSEMEDA